MEKFKCPKCGCETFLLVESAYSTASIIDGKIARETDSTSNELSCMLCNECGKDVVDFINDNNILIT
jgi:predicted nucleic-acid-binding Zn-ribbon protein